MVLKTMAAVTVKMALQKSVDIFGIAMFLRGAGRSSIGETWGNSKVTRFATAKWYQC